MTFSNAPKGRNNNLSFLRFLASVAVIFSHAFPLTGNGIDPLDRWSGEQFSLGNAAVAVFFFFGGFLIMRSMEGKKKAGPYFRARCLRIFPALWIVVVLCVLVLGPAMTTVSLGEYFTDIRTPMYLLNCLLLPMHPLPGVFENNPYVPTVNGSLWTLPVEFVCYVLCWVYYRLGFSKDRRKALISIPLVLLAAAAADRLLSGQELLRSAVAPVLFFFIGMQYYLFRDRIPSSPALCIAAAAVWIVSLRFGFHGIAGYICLPYILMYLGFGTERTLSRFGSRWELSYGIYLTAWPVQQILCAVFPGISWWWNFAGAAVLCIPAAFGVTWAEKKLARAADRRLPGKDEGK